MMSPVLTATWWVAFADGPGGGNPAPIVTDADHLSAQEMRRAAAGFGFETAFVLAPEAGGARRFRYFVPRRELEMCVHATGVAAGALAAYLDGRGVRPAAPGGYRIAQGRAMGRPSLITASLPDANGEIWVGGRAEPLAAIPAPLG
jgi:trans-2,3-dihydro-3-hydroxyanthranilate isomerase